MQNHLIKIYSIGPACEVQYIVWVKTIFNLGWDLKYNSFVVTILTTSTNTANTRVLIHMCAQCTRRIERVSQWNIKCSVLRHIGLIILLSFSLLYSLLFDIFVTIHKHFSCSIHSLRKDSSFISSYLFLTLNQFALPCNTLVILEE